jgi:hypothetical protein
LSTWGNGKTGFPDHVHRLAGLCHMDVMKSVVKLDQKLNRQNRGGDYIRDHIVLRSFDIEFQDVNVLQLERVQNGTVSHHIAYDRMACVALAEKLPRKSVAGHKNLCLPSNLAQIGSTCMFAGFPRAAVQLRLAVVGSNP